MLSNGVTDIIFRFKLRTTKGTGNMKLYATFHIFINTGGCKSNGGAACPLISGTMTLNPQLL